VKLSKLPVGFAHPVDVVFYSKTHIYSSSLSF
jgi:hypothetical protein